MPVARLFFIAMAVCALSLMGAEKDKEYVVGFAQDTMGNDWRVAQVRQVEEALAGYENIKFIYTDAGGDNAKQIQNIDDMMRMKVDVLITSPKNAKAMTPVIKKVYKSGIPVILLSRKIESDDYTTFIHPDNLLIARDSARYIAKKLNNKGRVFILQHTPSSTPGMLRTKGFMDEIKNYPDIEVVAMKVANSLRSEAIKMTEEAIEEKLEFDAIYAQSDSMASGARIALKKAGYDLSKIVITGIDYISEAQQAIKDGEQSASFLYPTAGKEGAEAAVKILHGEKVPKEVVLDTIIITKDNVEKIEPIF